MENNANCPECNTPSDTINGLCDACLRQAAMAIEATTVEFHIGLARHFSVEHGVGPWEALGVYIFQLQEDLDRLKATEPVEPVFEDYDEEFDEEPELNELDDRETKRVSLEARLSILMPFLQNVIVLSTTHQISPWDCALKIRDIMIQASPASSVAELRTQYPEIVAPYINN